MICQKCQEREHARCEDTDRGDAARYRSCNCQHQGAVKPEPEISGPEGE